MREGKKLKSIPFCLFDLMDLLFTHFTIDYTILTLCIIHKRKYTSIYANKVINCNCYSNNDFVINYLLLVDISVITNFSKDLKDIRGVKTSRVFSKH